MGFGTSSPPGKQKRGKGLLPIIGLTLAILFGLVAYFVAPSVVGLADKQDKINTQLEQFRDQQKYGGHIIIYVVAGTLWLFMLGLSVFFVSLSIGKDPDKDVFKYMPVSPANKKAYVKAKQRELKEVRKRAKERERSQKK
jgi:hypothetical protein